MNSLCQLHFVVEYDFLIPLIKRLVINAEDVLYNYIIHLQHYMNHYMWLINTSHPFQDGEDTTFWLTNQFWFYQNLQW